MSVLMWDKPEKMMSTEDWLKISADGAPAGVYTPNMSQDDLFKWKATLIGTKKGTPRVEIRKSFSKRDETTSGCFYVGVYCQCLIIVSLGDVDNMGDCNVLISMNGKAGMSFTEINEFNLAIAEAKLVLNKIIK